MLRRLAVVLFSLGLLRVLWSEGRVEAQYPWSTKTPTQRPTAVATRPPQPTIPVTVPSPTPTYYIPTYTPVPTGGSFVDLQITTVITGVAVSGFDPIKYEVQVAGQWYTIAPRAGCWTTATGVCPGLGPTPYFRITGRDGSVRQGPARYSQPRVLLAQNAGPITLISFTTPQVQ